MTTPPTPLTDRSRTRLVGTLFLAAILAYGIGTSLTTSVLAAPDALAGFAASAPQFTLGAALMLANSVIVTAIGVLLFPLLARRSRPVARIYLTGRLIEAVVLVVGVGFLVAVKPEVNDVAYQIAMAALGVSSLFFTALLFRTRMIPRFLAAWGFVGYAVFAAGAVLELAGVAGWGLPLSTLGGLFELAFGVWLIAKGFSVRPVAAPAAKEPVSA